MKSERVGFMTEKKYTAVVVDDEPVCIHNLRQSLSDYPEVMLTGEASTVKEGMRLILREKPNLLFLDVELPGMSGVELIQELRHRISWSMLVVFYTSHQEYWLDALRQSAFDYLLKPYTSEEFATIMNRFFEYVEQISATGSFEKALSELLPFNQSFMVADITGYQMLRVNEVGYFTYSKSNRQWSALMANGRHLTLGRNIKSEHVLSFSSSFLQINRHQIININYLCSIKGKTCCLIPPFDEEKELYISRNFQAQVQEKLRLM